MAPVRDGDGGVGISISRSLPSDLTPCSMFLFHATSPKKSMREDARLELERRIASGELDEDEE